MSTTVTPPGRPISDERLAEMRDCAEHGCWVDVRVLGEALDEIERLREFIRLTAAAEVKRGCFGDRG